MTPTMLGRLQTRTILLGSIGLFFTLLLWSFLVVIDEIETGNYDLFKVLFLVWLLGLFWDMVYQGLLIFRWDYDWPPIFQLLSGIWEWLIILLLVSIAVPPGSFRLLAAWWPTVQDDFWIVHAHYWLVWLTTFIASQGLLRILFPRWRFRGGQIGHYQS